MKSLISLHSLRRLGPALVLPLLAGCSSFFEAKPDTTRFFLLSAPSATVAPAGEVARTTTVGLCRVELPAYLRSPAVVVRPGGTEVKHAPSVRWAEPLDQGIARVLGEVIQAQPGVRSVVIYPAPQAATPAYEICVRVIACEGVVGAAGRQARFAATWEIRSTAATAVATAPVAAGTFESAPAAWSEGDDAALTATLGEAVAALGRELSAALPK